MMLIFYRVLMALTAVFCVISLGQVQNKLLRIAAVSLAIGTAWAVIDNPYLGNPFLLYYIGMVLFLVYTLTASGISAKNRAISLIIATFVLTHGIFAINLWPNVYELKWLQLIPLLLYFIFVLRKRKEYKQELGVLTIMAADALIQVISAIQISGQIR